MLEILAEMFVRFGKWYSACLVGNPYATNCLTGFLIASLGDVLCQLYFEEPEKSRISQRAPKHVENVKDIDKLRAVEMGVIRATIITPFTQYWYVVLARAFPGTNVTNVLGRVALDQAIGSPLTICMVFIGKSILHTDPKSSIDKIKNNLGPTWYCGVQYWPFMHFINFKFVPPIYQPLYASVASLYWNAILSFYANKAKPTHSANVNTSPVNVPARVGEDIV